MDRLTISEIETMREVFRKYWEGAGHTPEAPNALCDLALQSLSQEVVRDEALDEAANELERAFAEADTLNLLHGAARVRALKRESNAAAKIGQSYEVMGIEQAPAPAAPDVLEVETEFRLAKSGPKYEFDIEGKWPISAPDVASMVKRLRDYRCADPWAGSLMIEAAALLTKLGQGLACPRPQIMGEHACKDRTQCWEPCGDLGHHKEYARLAPGASED